MSFKIKIYLSYVLLPMNENMAKVDIMTESSAKVQLIKQSLLVKFKV